MTPKVMIYPWGVHFRPSRKLLGPNAKIFGFLVVPIFFTNIVKPSGTLL